MGKSILDFTIIKKRSGAEFNQIMGRSGTIFWCKPCTLTLSSKPTGVNTITCYRYSSNQPGAATGTSATLTNGSTIYYGDVIYISATASTGYNNPTISSSTGVISSNKLTVDGNESINIVAGSEKIYSLSFAESDYGTWNNTTPISAPYSAIISRSGNTIYCNGESRTFTVKTNTSLISHNFSLTGYTNDSGIVSTGKTVSANFDVSQKPYGMRLQGKFMYYNGINNFGVKIIKLSGYEAFPVTCTCTYVKGPGEGTDTDSSNIPVRSDDSYTTVHGGYWQGVNSVNMEIKSQGRIQTGGYFNVHTNTELYPEGTEYVDVYSNGVNQFSPDWYGNN